MLINLPKLKIDKKFFLLLFMLSFIFFVFSSDGHRYTIDEFHAHKQTLKIATQEIDPLYVQGESRVLFHLPEMFPWESGQFCKTDILCYPVYIGHTLTQVPFVFVNHHFNIINDDTLLLDSDDFDEPHYVYWRNTQNADLTFLELFYGPLFSSLTISVFYLICRTFQFNQRTSIILTLFLGFATPIWAYSQTSLNTVPEIFFILLGFFYFRKFQNTGQMLRYLIISAISFGFAFLVRPDAILFIAPMFLFLFYLLKQQNQKIKKSLSFIATIFSFYFIYVFIDYLRIGTLPFFSTVSNVEKLVSTTAPASVDVAAPLHEGLFVLLLSPGAGLLIFTPILFTVFFSFPDFFSKHKKETILLTAFVLFFLIFFGRNDPAHGLVAWAARYLIPITPFLLLPLGASLQTRNHILFFPSLIILAGLGVFFNFIYIIQDVSWFVWTYPGSNTGLFGLSTPEIHLYIHPATIWTFEYSQLTHSIIEMLYHFQHDIYLLHLMGPIAYISSLSIVGLILGYFILKNLKKSSNVI